MFDVEKLKQKFDAEQQHKELDRKSQQLQWIHEEYAKYVDMVDVLHAELTTALENETYPEPASITYNDTTDEYCMEWQVFPGASAPDIVKTIRDITKLFPLSEPKFGQFKDAGLDPNAIGSVFNNVCGYRAGFQFIPSQGPWEQASNIIARLYLKK